MIRTALLSPGARTMSPADGAGKNVTLVGDLHLLDGSTCPGYVKLLNPKRLANELVASELARLLGFNVPECFLVLVQRHDYAQLLGPGDTPAVVAFGTRSVPAERLAQRINLDDPIAATWFFQTTKDWQRVVGFDCWVANVDRHRANILFAPDLKLWLIDHDLAFIGDTPFSVLVPGAQTTNRLIDLHVGQMTAQIRQEVVDNATVMLAHAAAVIDITGVMDDCCVRLNFSDDEVHALVLYLTIRVSQLQRLIGDALGVPTLAP